MVVDSSCFCVSSIQKFSPYWMYKLFTNFQYLHSCQHYVKWNNMKLPWNYSHVTLFFVNENKPKLMNIYLFMSMILSSIYYLCIDCRLHRCLLSLFCRLKLCLCWMVRLFHCHLLLHWILPWFPLCKVKHPTLLFCQVFPSY